MLDWCGNEDVVLADHLRSGFVGNGRDAGFGLRRGEMGMLWMEGLAARDRTQTSELALARQQTQKLESYIRELQHDVVRLS